MPVEMLRVLIATEIRLDPARAGLGHDLGSYLAYHVEQSEQLARPDAQIEERGDMALRYDDDVRLERGPGVTEREHLGGLTDLHHRRPTRQRLGTVKVLGAGGWGGHLASATASGKRARRAWGSATAIASAAVSCLIAAPLATRCGSIR